MGFGSIHVFAFFENFKPAGIATPAMGPKSLQLLPHGVGKLREIMVMLNLYYLVMMYSV